MMNKFLLTILLSGSALSSPASEGVRKLDTDRSPREFLDELCSYPEGVYAIEEPVRDWIKEGDVAELIELIDSAVPCSSVALAASSRLRWKSTMGDEAAFLIRGFRRGEYPPALTSEQLFDSDRAALRLWWEQHDERDHEKNGSTR